MNSSSPTTRKDRLIRVSDADSGYTRRKSGRGFSYRDTSGKTIRDKAERKRIQALVIPPAWTDVWICPDPRGHILATGRDDRGRKQYIYHPQWHENRQQAKFNHLSQFGESLPALRKKIQAHLKRRGLTREKVLAVVVRLLEETLIRIGNTYYTRENNSYGLTTLQDEHVAITGKRVEFEFTGKSGVEHQIDVEDQRLAALIKACRDVPGYDLFQYYDDKGERCTITSGDVNDYLRSLTSADFTSKEFRTWGSSKRMIEILYSAEPAPDEKTARRNVLSAIKEVAEHLGNTVAVARSHYIHPAIAEAYINGTLHEIVDRQKEEKSEFGLDRFELALMALIDEV